MKKTLKVALYILLALVLIVLAYVIYVFAAYYRVEDMQKLGVAHCDAASGAPMEGAPQTGVTYRVSSANVGFGAYSADYSFFMDGGKESRARSRQAVDENMRGEVSLVKDLSPDFALFQEVDIYGTRSWHIAEDAYLDDVMENSEFNKVFAQNYDSPYLFYPLINPPRRKPVRYPDALTPPDLFRRAPLAADRDGHHEACRPRSLLLRQPHPDGKRQGAGAL
ncbi:MAG: hypothetical protein ACLU38_14330 [Dysosmobacter sp.]